MPETFDPQNPTEGLNPEQIQQLAEEQGIDVDSVLEEVGVPKIGLHWLLPFILVFIVLFYRKWRAIRLGFWFVAVVVLSVRWVNAEDYFWYAFAAVSAVFAWIMAVMQTMTNVEAHRNEPLFYALIAIPLTAIFLALKAGPEAGEPPPFLMVSCFISAFASVFFINAPKARIKEKRGSYIPDDSMLDNLKNRKRYRL